MFDRRVTRIVTPGTLIDEKFMNPYENNFLLAVHPIGLGTNPPSSMKKGPADLMNNPIDPSLSSIRVGLAWLDLSTGEFFSQSTNMVNLPSALARIGAKEIIISDILEPSISQSIASIIEHDHRVLTYHAGKNAELPITSWASMLETSVPTADEPAFTQEETSAGSMLLTYVADNLQGLDIKLQRPQRRQEFETMSIDKNSLRGLEILATCKEGIGGGKGSLLHTIRRTVTRSGSRLLKDWISSPSTSLPLINARLELVSTFVQTTQLKEDIVNELRRTSDCQRLVQQFSMGRGDADDLVSLLRTIETTESIARIIAQSSNESRHETEDPLRLLSRQFSFEGPRALAVQISDAIDEDALLQSHQRDESESAGYVSTAQAILQSEGSVADQAAMSRVLRARVVQPDTSEQEQAEEDTWIMRKTFV